MALRHSIKDISNHGVPTEASLNIINDGLSGLLVKQLYASSAVHLQYNI